MKDSMNSGPGTDLTPVPSTRALECPQTWISFIFPALIPAALLSMTSILTNLRKSFNTSVKRKSFIMIRFTKFWYLLNSIWSLLTLSPSESVLSSHSCKRWPQPWWDPSWEKIWYSKIFFNIPLTLSLQCFTSTPFLTAPCWGGWRRWRGPWGRWRGTPGTPCSHPPSTRWASVCRPSVPRRMSVLAAGTSSWVRPLAGTTCPPTSPHWSSRVTPLWRTRLSWRLEITSWSHYSLFSLSWSWQVQCWTWV